MVLMVELVVEVAVLVGKIIRVRIGCGCVGADSGV